MNSTVQLSFCLTSSHAPTSTTSYTGLFVIVFGFATLWHETGLAASFDCAQPSKKLEKTICADSELSKADEEMAKAFSKLKDSLDAEESKIFLEEQRAWLQQRTKNCSVGNAACLSKFYRKRLEALQARIDNIVPFGIDDQSSFQGVRGTCSFADLKFPENYVLYAAGDYGGRTLVDALIDKSGHRATQFDVIVNSPDRPVALIFSAYEPSIWNVGWTKGTKILAVVATGYYRQAVAGLPRSTPLLISTNDNRSLCGLSYASIHEPAGANTYATKVFGKPVNMIYLASSGKIVIGAPEIRGTPLTSRDVPPESFIQRTEPLVDPMDALKDGVARGLLRPATEKDANRWADKWAIKTGNASLHPVTGNLLRGPLGDNVFVILKAFTLPDGLYGKNDAFFYLVEGVPYPKGELHHAAIYDFNTMTCHGLICSAWERFGVGTR